MNRTENLSPERAKLLLTYAVQEYAPIPMAQKYNEYYEALKLAKSTIERSMVAKKPTHEATLLRCCTCPTCKNVIDKFEKFGDATVRVTYNYCHFCGQKLDWSEVE